MICATGSKSAADPGILARFRLRPCGYWMDGLPPVSDRDRLALEVGLVRAVDRDDAVQVAWLAHLEGRDARLAVKAWWMATLRQRSRERTNTDP